MLERLFETISPPGRSLRGRRLPSRRGRASGMTRFARLSAFLKQCLRRGEALAAGDSLVAEADLRND